MLRLINGLAAKIENSIQNDTLILGSCCKFMLSKSMADVFLNMLFKSIAYNASTAAIVLLVVYLVICIIYLPLFWFSYLITSFGSLMLLVVGIGLFLRSISRSMTFAGSNLNLQKEYSADYLRRVLQQIEQFAGFVAQFAATLLLILNNKLPYNETMVMLSKIQQLQSVSASLCDVFRIVDLALSAASRSTCYGGILATDAADPVLLKSNISAVTKLITDLVPHLEPIISARIRAKQSQSTSPHGNRARADSAQESTVLLLTSRLLGAAEDLRKGVIAMRPKPSSRQVATNGGPDESNDPLAALLAMLGSINSAPIGIEKLSFPIMRVKLRDEYWLEDMQLVGTDGNMIDAVYVPSKERKMSAKAALLATSSGNSNPTVVNDTSTVLSSVGSASVVGNVPGISSLGTVLYCPPNAGIFECLSQCPPSTSWLSFYTQLGFDVCLFNYRGYCRSTGVPTPDRCKSDAEVLLRHLRQNKKVARLIIHGESLGGMIACHLGMKYGAELVVCDRTFASLDSLAERMMGRWAAYGLRYIGCWYTDVVTDYLSIRGPKVILQDPRDEVISNSASLKNGVASYLVLGDKDYGVGSLPRDYRVSDLLGHPPPCPDIIEKQSNSAVVGLEWYQSSNDGLDMSARYMKYLISTANVVTTPLREEFVVHLFSYVLLVCRSAAYAFLGRTASPNKESLLPISGSDISLNEFSGHESLDGSSTHGSEDDFASDYCDASADLEDGQQSQHLRINPESAQDTRSSSSQRSQPLPKYSAMDLRRAYGWLLHASYQDQTLSRFERAWVIISKIDGGSGQSLADSLGGGFDWFRSWVCSYIVWSNRAVTTTTNSLTINQAIRMLTECVEIPSANADETLAIRFLRDALVAIETRKVTACSLDARLRQESGLHSWPEIGMASQTICSVLGRLYRANSEVPIATPTSDRRSPDSDVGSYEMVGMCADDGLERDPTGIRQENGSANILALDHRIGHVIPFQTGHNGWPKEPELKSVRAVLKLAGFSVPS